jgi:hypothetical protein
LVTYKRRNFIERLLLYVRLTSQDNLCRTQPNDVCTANLSTNYNMHMYALCA